ncbi:hypothetical protein [Streptomyces scopuliridis]|uniref:hypothetical protein n=1 Tax=Streptomyces scopuliridis TaxID=452529 RepID=UPI00342652D4
MSPTYTFQDHGPVLDTVLRIHPAHGTTAFDAARRLTVPMEYLAVLHRTREVVLYVSPNGRSYVIDWARTNLLTGTTVAKVIAPDGRELPVQGRPDVIWALMNLLASHGLSNPTPVLGPPQAPDERGGGGVDGRDAGRGDGRTRLGSFVWIRADQGAGSGAVDRKAELGAHAGADGVSPGRAKPRPWG